MKISLLIPTRGRPDYMNRILSELAPVLSESGEDNQNSKNVAASYLDPLEVELLLGIDEDDNSYDTKSIEQLSGVRIIRTPKTPYLSNIYNILFEYSSGEIVGYLSDDITFQNLSVFDHIVKTFIKRGNILYFFSQCDLPYPQCVPDHGFVSAVSARALGFFALPNMEHGYIDHYLGLMYKETGCYYLNKMGPLIHLRNDLEDDETYRIKTSYRDENGTTCDERDLLKFNDYIGKYLHIHQDIIMSLNPSRKGDRSGGSSSCDDPPES